MKHLLYILFSLSSLMASGQTTIVTSAMRDDSADLVAPGRSLENWATTDWDGTNVPKVPTGNIYGSGYYQRFVWGQVETAPYTYSFADFDSYVKRAIDRGQMFSFGVMTMCTSCDAMPTYGYPTYLHNLMQAETTNSRDWLNAEGNWVPNWNSPNYLSHRHSLDSAFAAHINATSYAGVQFKNVILYVDIRGYGDFGEWHTYPFTDEQPTGRVATEASLEAIVNCTKDAFPNNQLVIPMGAFDTDPGHSSRLPAQFGYYVLTTSNNYGQIGWRRDNYGDPQYDGWLTNSPGIYNGNSFTPLIMNKYKFAPVDGEPNNTPYSVCCTTGFSCPAGTSGLYCNIVNEVNLFHVNTMGNGNYPLGLGSSILSNITKAGFAMGYRLLITGGTISTSGTTLTVSANWRNKGIAPAYMKWEVVYQLRKTDGTVVGTWISAFSPYLFAPSGSSTAEVDHFSTTGIPTGVAYNLFVTVKDPNAYAQPMPLALYGRDVTGSYKLGSITLGGGTTGCGTGCITGFKYRTKK